MVFGASNPLRPEPDDAGHLRGRHIEQRLWSFLSNERQRGSVRLFSQPDVLAVDVHGRPFLIETKGQDYFTAPPFDGHGLPLDQLRRYEEIRAASGLRTLFMVWDQLGLCLQWLDVLEGGQHHDLPGTIKTPRRIYPLTSFQRRHVHTAAHGAPTDEPPPPQPADTDPDATTPLFGDDNHPDTFTLPTDKQADTRNAIFDEDPDGWTTP